MAARCFGGLVELLAGHYPELDDAAARRASLAVASGMVGAFTMARLVSDADADEVLDAAALALAALG